MLYGLSSLCSGPARIGPSPIAVLCRTVELPAFQNSLDCSDHSEIRLRRLEMGRPEKLRPPEGRAAPKFSLRLQRPIDMDWGIRSVGFYPALDNSTPISSESTRQYMTSKRNCECELPLCPHPRFSADDPTCTNWPESDGLCNECRKSRTVNERDGDVKDPSPV